MSIPVAQSTTNLIEARLRSRLPTWYPGGKVDQFIRKIPFYKMDKWTEKIVWNREADFSVHVDAVASYDPESTQRTAAAIDVTGSPEEAVFARFGDFIEVDIHQDPATFTGQIQVKKAAVVRKLGDQVLNSTGNTWELNGFISEVDANQQHSVAPNNPPNVPKLEDWEFLASLVRPSDGMVGSGPDCFVCHGQMWRHLLMLIRQAALNPQFAYDEVLGVPVLHYCGIPVYVGQNSQEEEDPYNYQSVWAVKLRGPTGVKLCHVGGEAGEFGIRVENLDRFMPNYPRHAKFIGGYYALLIPEKESIARMYKISTSSATLGLKQQVP